MIAREPIVARARQHSCAAVVSLMRTHVQLYKIYEHQREAEQRLDAALLVATSGRGVHVDSEHSSFEAWAAGVDALVVQVQAPKNNP